MRFVIKALETEQEFSAIMIFIGATVAVFAGISLYYSYVNGTVTETSGTYPDYQAIVIDIRHQRLMKPCRIDSLYQIGNRTEKEAVCNECRKLGISNEQMN